MIRSALALVLSRLDQIEAPVFSHAELACFPAAELAVLRRDGILYEGCPAEEIDRPSRFRGGGRLAIRRTARGIFGCPCEGDPYFDPLPLTEDDGRQYEVSIDRLIDRLRSDNGIDGSGYASSGQTFALGQRDVEGWSTVDVYLGVGMHDDAALLSACLHMKTDTSPRGVVLLVPRAVATSPDRRRAIDATAVRVEPLSDIANRGSLVVSWRLVLGAPGMRHERHVPKDIRVFCREAVVWTVAFEGRSASVPHSLGMYYIRHLLERPSQLVDAAELTTSTGRTGRARIVEAVTRLSKAKDPDDSLLPGLGHAALDRAEAEARRTGDTKRLHELRQIRSLTGSDERTEAGKSSAEAAAAKGTRQSVSAAITRAIGKISAQHPRLGQHLSDSIEFGSSMFYKGDPKDRWVTEGGSA